MDEVGVGVEVWGAESGKYLVLEVEVAGGRSGTFALFHCRAYPSIKTINCRRRYLPSEISTKMKNFD